MDKFKGKQVALDKGRTHTEQRSIDTEAPYVRQPDNFRYILIPEIINVFMTNISDPVRAKHVHVFKLNLK
jgi:hypothetical protein